MFAVARYLCVHRGEGHMKITSICLAIVFSIFCLGISFAPTPAEAFATCKQLKQILRKYQREGNQIGVEGILGPDGHGMDYTCSGQLYRDQRAMRNGTFQQQQNDEMAGHVAAFLSGLAEGMANSYTPGGSTVSRGGSVRSSTGARTVYRSSGQIRTVNTTVSSPAIRQTTVQRSVQSNQTTAASGAPIGYIKQPNGKLDPYYSKQPCATLDQTGTTTYTCTNR